MEGFIPGGKKRGDESRYMNHFSPYPAGDSRNKAGSRVNAEVNIEYDIIRWRTNAQATHLDWEVFYPNGFCVVTGHVVEGYVATRVFETRTGINLWRNKAYVKGNKLGPIFEIPAERLSNVELRTATAAQVEAHKRKVELAKAGIFDAMEVDDDSFVPPEPKGPPPAHLLAKAQAASSSSSSGSGV